MIAAGKEQHHNDAHKNKKTNTKKYKKEAGYFKKEMI